MKISRRDILKFAVGSAAGVMLTPVPWKVLDDSAIWTQNWPWIPVPRKGETTTRFTTCTLCPAGCGIKARCIAGQPVSLTGVADHPLSSGTLCPIGLGGHHLAYHPGRILHPLRRSRKSGTFESRPVTLDEATEAVAEAIRSASAAESVALLDQQPGRRISTFYRRLFARLPRGLYLRPPVVEDATLAASASMMGMQKESLGFDLENAHMLVSFGAPLFDGWGTPGRMMRIGESRRQNALPKIVQIETRQSRTALQADTWVSIKPGTEATFALGLAHVLVREQLCNMSRLRAMASDFDRNDATSYLEVLARFTPGEVSAITGVTPDRIRAIARSMAAGGPTIVLGAGDPAGGPLRTEENIAIASLNFLLGSVGQKGGIVMRRNLAAPTGDDAAMLPERQFQEVPDRSIRVLILDGAESGHALPWSLIERKLADEKALVVSLSPYSAGLAQHAEIIIPSPAFLESLQDAPPSFHLPVATFSISASLLTPPPETTEPGETIGRIAAAAGIATEEPSFTDQLKAYVQALHSSDRGSIFVPADTKTTPVKELDSSEQLWGALVDGGCWTDDPVAPATPSRLSFFKASGVTPRQLMTLGERKPTPESAVASLALMPFGWRGTAGSGQVSPLMSKVYQESGLRDLSNEALVNPETGKARGMADNATTMLETPAGAIQVHVRFDPSVMPDVLHVAVGPDRESINDGGSGDPLDILSMCLAEDGRSWRVAPAKVSKRTA